MGTMKNPSPADLAGALNGLAEYEMGPDALASLVASIRSWPTGRLATGTERHGAPVIVSWQAIGGSTYVTLR
jgi:hypothetical protein